MRGALEGCEGVTNVEISYGTKTAVATIEPGKAEAENPLDAVRTARGTDFAETSLVQ